MLKRNKLNIYLLQWIIISVVIMGCAKSIPEIPERPNLETVVTNHFSTEQIAKVERQFNEYMDELIFYRYPSVLQLVGKEWKILNPIYIKSDYSRMVAFIPNWQFEKGKTQPSMIWMTGFYADSNWHFKSTNEAQYMNTVEGTTIDFDPLEHEPTRIAIEKWTSGYIKIDIDTKDWIINDDWFSRFFQGDIDQLDMNEEDWINRNMKIINISNYLLSKIKYYLDEEDDLHREKKISDEEWEKIQGRRCGTTDEDIRNLKKLYREILFNDNDTTYVNLMDEAFPGYKMKLEERRKYEQ